MESDRAYALGHSAHELERLTAQARLFEPFTRQLFEEAGLRSGMRVLDVGSGSGDVAFLAASIVGDEGQVTGIDAAPAAVELANLRARALHLNNVRFMAADATQLSFERPFDAVVGRLVLGYIPDPAGTIRRLASLAHSGSIIAFQEFDFAAARSYPPSPLAAQCIGWMIEAFGRTGFDLYMGLRLYSTFIGAGLPAPKMRLDAAVGCGRSHLIYFVVSEVIRSLLPLLQKFDVATAAEIDIETLRDRLEAEISAAQGVLVSPSLIGAWAHVP